MTDKPPTTTLAAAKVISEEMDVSYDTVREILDRYIAKILKCLEEELPFVINGFGKFYYIYRRNQPMTVRLRPKEFFFDKVHREVRFHVAHQVRQRLQGWVHDLGIKNNMDRSELMKLKIRPEEIAKTRRQRILEDQRAMGFRPELLFDEDEMTEADKDAMNSSKDAPSIDEMLKKLGVNIDLNK